MYKPLVRTWCTTNTQEVFATFIIVNNPTLGWVDSLNNLYKSMLIICIAFSLNHSLGELLWSPSQPGPYPVQMVWTP